jgi:hypothetical protein
MSESVVLRVLCYFRRSVVAVCVLWSTVYGGLQFTAVCGLRSVVCGLQFTSVCGLWSTVRNSLLYAVRNSLRCGLRSVVCGLWSSVFVLRFAIHCAAVCGSLQSVACDLLPAVCCRRSVEVVYV